MNICVLFDLDGTLVDSEQIAVESFREAFAECVGCGDPPVSEFLAMAGMPFERIVERLTLPTAMVDLFRQYSVARSHRVRLFAGISPMLTMLASADVRMGIITGKDRPRAEQIIGRLGLDCYCTELVTPSDPPAPKPSPDGVQWLLRRLRGEAAGAVLVGDSPNDIRAGQAAGVRTVACTWGAGLPPALTAARPDELVHSVAELTGVLAGHARLTTSGSRS
nr:HAD hydrolase-like protein [uncultured Actinoplanes sp.]